MLTFILGDAITAFLQNLPQLHPQRDIFSDFRLTPGHFFYFVIVKRDVPLIYYIVSLKITGGCK